MRLEGARLVALGLSALGHGALLGWLGAGGGAAIEPPQPITVAIVVEAPPAAPAAAPAMQPDPPAETRGPPPVEPLPPVEAAAPMPKAETPPAVAPEPVPAPPPLTKPAPAVVALAPKVPESPALVAPAAGGSAREAPTHEPAPPAAAASGPAVAALLPRAAAPMASGNAPPVYPLAARRQGIEGRVILDVAVDAEGRAIEVTVATSSGSRLLDEAALKAVRNWRFTPASLGGTPIAARVQVPITFRLDAPG